MNFPLTGWKSEKRESDLVAFGHQIEIAFEQSQREYMVILRVCPQPLLGLRHAAE